MRLIAVLAVLAIVGWLAAHEIAGTSSAPPDPQRIVNSARHDLDRAHAAAQPNLDEQP